MKDNIILILVSFFTSGVLGVGFQIRRKDLIWACVGGALIRTVYLFFMAMSGNIRPLSALLAAVVAGLYAELLATRKKMPSTVFLYPSIIPLVPGDLLYYMTLSLIMLENEAAKEYTWTCVWTLLGLSVGFVLSSTIAHYIRVWQLKVNLKNSLLRPFKGVGRQGGGER
ncbi:MAG: threonine/serine exporter family protein [Clostridiales bacterium]|nr:threonine/serine exporter family protein [Clostridiales bacterium]